MPARHASSRRVAPAAAAVLAAAALTVAACGDDDDTTSTTAGPPTTIATTPLPATTAPAPESSAPAPSAPPTTEPLNTFPPASASPTTTPPPQLTGATLELVSPFMPNPFLLERVVEAESLVVYDGEAADGDFKLRCVAVGHDGEATWSEWCGLPADTTTFVVVDGIDPWVAVVGPEHGDVTLARQPSSWVVTSSGCTDPLVTLIDAAGIAPATATGLVCVGDEAFLTFGAVFMQPGPVDGGGALLTRGDEGWNTEASGTSVPCEGSTDGVDRCSTFAVESELYEATSPIPSPDQLAPAEQFVGVRDVTDDVQGLADQATDTDIDAITEAIVAGLAEPDSEVQPTVSRHDGVSSDRYHLLVVDVPALDDSIGSTTWAVWITTETAEIPSTVHRAYAWDNCARGVADADACV